MKRWVIISATISIGTVMTIFFVVNIFSHSECGTAGIDFMPCAYWPRAVWNIQNGFWIPLVFLAILVFIGSILVQRYLLRH